MKKSKYLNKIYDNNWKVVAYEIAGRYGKRNKAKGNSYRFFLARLTSDGKFEKTICVSRPTMKKIDIGELTVESAEGIKIKFKSANEFRNTIYYSFN